MKGKRLRILGWALGSAAVLLGLYWLTPQPKPPPGPPPAPPRRSFPKAKPAPPPPIPKPSRKMPSRQLQPRRVSKPDFSKRLAAVEKSLAETEVLGQIEVRVPAETLNLGRSSKSYQCWEMRLASARGIEVRSLMLRIRGLRTAAVEVRERLSNELQRYHALEADRKGAGKALAVIQISERRLTAHSDALQALLNAFQELQALGEKSGLLAPSKSINVLWMGFGQRVIAPRMEGEDYVMKYDDSDPACAARARGNL